MCCEEWPEPAQEDIDRFNARVAAGDPIAIYVQKRMQREVNRILTQPPAHQVFSGGGTIRWKRFTPTP